MAKQETTSAPAAPNDDGRVRHVTLAAAICGVMADTGNIPKSGKNTFHNYAYATDGDIMAECRQALARHGVVVLLKGAENVRLVPGEGPKSDNYYYADFRFVIHHADSTESFEVAVPAGGQDRGEKAAYKALTGAKKYLYLTTFALATGGDDPEDDRGGRGSARDTEPDLDVWMRIDTARHWATAVETFTKLRSTRIGSVRTLLNNREIKSATELSEPEMTACIKFLQNQPTKVQGLEFERLCTDMVLDAEQIKMAQNRFSAAAKFEEFTVKEATALLLHLQACLGGKAKLGEIEVPK